MSTHSERAARFAEFSETIRELFDNEPIVHRVLSAYCYGDIATKEEAFTTAIVALVKMKNKMMEALLDQVRMSPFPPIISPHQQPHNP